MSILWSYLFGAMFFLFCSYLRSPTSDGFEPKERKNQLASKYDIEEEQRQELYNLDTLRINEKLLALVLNNWTLGFLGIYFYFYQLFDNKTLNDTIGYLGLLSISQLLILCMSLFLPKANETTPEWYTKFMPELLYGLALVSQLVFPVVIIALAIFIMAGVEGSDLTYPFLVFICVMESGIFYSYIVYYYEPFKQEYEYWVKQRNIMIQINKRKKHLVEQGFQMPTSDRDPKNRQLRNALEGEDPGFAEKVNKHLEKQSKSYFER